MLSPAVPQLYAVVVGLPVPRVGAAHIQHRLTAPVRAPAPPRPRCLSLINARRTISFSCLSSISFCRPISCLLATAVESSAGTATGTASGPATGTAAQGDGGGTAQLQRLDVHGSGGGHQNGIAGGQLCFSGGDRMQHALSDQPAVKHLPA